MASSSTAHPRSAAVLVAGRSCAPRAGTLAATLCTLALLATAALGCNADAAQIASSAKASVAPRPSSAPFSGDSQEALAMADPGGSEPVDLVIKAYQESAKKMNRVDDWIPLAQAWIRKARETADPGYYLYADACAAIVLSRAPDDPLALGIRGQVELNAHKFKTALATAELVLASRPDDIPALGNKSDALLELGDYAEAVKVTDRMIQLKPSLPSYARGAMLSWLHGEDEKARETSKMAIESSNDPSNPEPRCYALVQAAHIFWHKGDYAGADAGYIKALGECPEYHHALLGRGKVALAKGDAKASIGFLERAAKKSKLIEISWRLGDAKLAAGDTAGAQAEYDALVARGKNEDKRTVAQFLATKNRDIPEAIRLAREEMGARPGIYTEDALAWSLYRKGELDEALKLAKHALRLGTPDATLEYHLGAILIASGKKEEGAALVAKALERNPKFDPTGAEEAVKLAPAK